MADSATLLSEVETALSALVQRRVQSYKVDGREFTFLDIGELKRMRRELKREVAAQARRKKGGIMGRVRWGSS